MYESNRIEITLTNKNIQKANSNEINVSNMFTWAVLQCVVIENVLYFFQDFYVKIQSSTLKDRSNVTTSAQHQGHIQNGQ